MAKNIREIVKEGYEKGDYAKVFRANDSLKPMEKKFLDYLISSIPSDAKILDLGCGTGIPFDKYLAEKGFKITGIDIAHSHITEAQKNIPEAFFIEGDFSKINFSEERFHAIIALYSIFHIPREEQGELLGKMYDLLEDSGMILLTFGTSGSNQTEEDWCGAPMAWSNYTAGEYKDMLKEAGFSMISSEYEGKPGDEEYHWWVLAKK